MSVRLWQRPSCWSASSYNRWSQWQGPVTLGEPQEVKIEPAPKLPAPPPAESPVVQQPAEQQPATQQPAEQQPATQQQAEQQPATRQPAEQQPATQQPAEQQPATQQPAEQQPATQQPAEQQPATRPQAEQQPATTGQAAEPQAPPVPAEEALSFDIVRVEGDGAAVVTAARAAGGRHRAQARWGGHRPRPRQ